MNGPDLLMEQVGVLRTKVGGCWPGKRAVFRGHDLHQDLHDADFMELYLFGITGRRFTPQQTKLLHGMFVITSYPDTRLWNNRVAGLAGNSRSSPALGLSAALAVSEALIYGGGAGSRAIDFFFRAGKAVNEGQDIREFLQHELATRYIYGYGRPIDSYDERLPWLAKVAREQGMGEGLHFKLAFEIEHILTKEMDKPGLLMNYAGMTSSLGADLGLSQREFQLLRVPAFFGGMPPCFVEAAEKPAGALLPTPCSGVSYEGIENRPWPARASK